MGGRKGKRKGGAGWKKEGVMASFFLFSGKKTRSALSFFCCPRVSRLSTYRGNARPSIIVEMTTTTNLTRESGGRFLTLSWMLCVVLPPPLLPPPPPAVPRAPSW